MRLKNVVFAMAMLAPAAASAQTVEASEPTVVEGLVVDGRQPGPAWWSVSDDDTTIFVLGAPRALPRGMAWDTSTLNARLKGAFAYIKPPAARAGLGDIPALLRVRKSLQAEHPLEQRSPALAARLARAWAAADPCSPNGWRDWKPLGAALFLVAKADKGSKFDDRQPGKAIEALARRNRVPVRAAATYKAAPMMSNLARQHSEAQGLACLEDVLDDVERGADTDRNAARAWADGRVRASLAARQGLDRCGPLLTGASTYVRQATDDEVRALSEALKTPGHAVAVYPIRELLAENGVLDQLRARGYTVRTPAELSP